MSTMPTPIVDVPTELVPAATSTTPGTVPQYPIPQAGVVDLVTQLTTAATKTLLESGAKATVSVTLIAFGTWADGQTIAVPGVAAKTIKMTAAGDIDVSGAGDVAAGAAIIGAYMAAAVGSLVDYVGTVGQVMTFRAKAYGRALNGQFVSGTLLTAAVAMADGVDPYDGKTVRSELVYDAAVSGASVTVGGLSSAKRYHIEVQAAENGASEWVEMQPNGSAAGCHCTYQRLTGAAYENAAAANLFTLWNGDTAIRSASVVIEPRRNGISRYSSCVSTNAALIENNSGTHTAGSMTTDFTSLTFVFSATSRNGWLTITEETP